MGVWLVVAGLAVHIVFFYSIFDIYFTSPLVHGMTPHSVPLKPPAKRLLLFVADGLRADKFFELEEDGSSRAPFLRTIIEQRGAWGVSHTRVPTESRPGHVALIAGFYEDVSAVAKGWKENPVEFDSLFNESRYTWSWGSPDILPMFSKGASGDHVFIDMYPSESEDFAGSDTSKLDTWVFDRVKDFLSEGRKNVTLGNMLHQDKLVFFLHLLGIDTNGHSHKPYSKEYLDNIRIVDSGIRELTSLIEEFYEHDGRTAYIMSADHGMTDWGSHGASHPSETLTPLVAWGAGVRGPNMGEEIQEKQAFRDTFSQDWDLSHISRKDVEQADITSLMAALIGTSFPVNSVGVLPLDYINASDEFKAHAIFTNTQQILAQLTIKMAEKQETTLSWLFRPYKALPVDNQIQFVKSIQNKIHGKEYREAIEDSRELIKLALDGLEYYHGYDRLFLGASIAMGYLGWITYILTIIIQDYTNIVATSKIAQSQATYLRSEEGIRTIFAILGAIVAFLLYVQSLPWTHYIYCLLPIMLWNEALLKINVISQVKESIEGVGNLMMIIFKVFVAVAGLEILVLTFFYRELLTLGLVAMAIWPIMTSLRSSNKMVVVFWSVSCLSVAVFPMLPVVGRDTDYRLVSLAGWTILALGLYAFRQLSKNAFYSPIRSNKLHVLFFSQLVTLGVAIIILNSTSSSIASKQGLPLLNQGLSWLILVLSVLQPLLGSTHMVPRLLSLGVSLSAPYILLSMSHEALFYLSLCCLLYAWLLVEYSNTSHTIKANELDFSKGSVLGAPTRNLHTADLRVAYFFVFFILTAFFGTGNIASINSFDPVSVYCFLTIFNPFIMGALMLWKIVILFILVTCTFSAIHVILNVPTKSLFMVVLLMSDFMALHFFFLVRDSGSWLEIGTSISHYVIVMTMIIFLMLLLGIAKLFTTFQFTCTSRRKSHFQ